MGWLDTLNAGLESFNEGVDSLDRWLYTKGMSPDALWFGKPPGAPGGAQMGISDVVPGIAALPPSKGPGPKPRLPRGGRPPRPPKAPVAPPAAPAPEPGPRRLSPEILARAKAGDEQAVEEVLRHVRPMVRQQTGKYGRFSEDALQEANLIALEKIRQADPEKPGLFMSALRKDLRHITRTIDPMREAAPLSRETRELIRRVDRFKQKVEQHAGHEISLDAAIKGLKLSPFEKQALQDAYASPALARKIELDRPRYDDAAEGLHDTVTPREFTTRDAPVEGEAVAGHTATPADRMAQKDYRKAIAFALRQARQEDPRRAAIWRSYEQGKTESEIARQFGVSQPAVNKTITRMRERLAELARSRYEGVEPPAARQARKPGGAGPAKPFPPPKRPPIQGGSDADIEFIGVQEGFGSIPEMPLWNLKRDFPGHPAGSTVGPETLRKLGIRVPNTRPPISGGSGPLPSGRVRLLHDPDRVGKLTGYTQERNGLKYYQIEYDDPTGAMKGWTKQYVPADQIEHLPDSVGAAAYRDPAADVQQWVDSYRRFVMTGGPDKEPDPNVVRQLRAGQNIVSHEDVSDVFGRSNIDTTTPRYQADLESLHDVKRALSREGYAPYEYPSLSTDPTTDIMPRVNTRADVAPTTLNTQPIMEIKGEAWNPASSSPYSRGWQIEPDPNGWRLVNHEQNRRIRLPQMGNVAGEHIQEFNRRLMEPLSDEALIQEVQRLLRPGYGRQEPPPQSVGAAAYQDPLDDVQKFVDEYRRFVMTGGPDKAPDPEIVRQLQNPGQKTEPAFGQPDAERLLLGAADYPSSGTGSGEMGYPPTDRFRYTFGLDEVPEQPMRMPGFIPSLNKYGQPSINAPSPSPIFNIKDEIEIPRPGPRGIPPKLSGAGAEGNPYTTPLDPDQRIQLKGVNTMGANLSGGASYDTSRYPANFKAEMMQPDRLKLMENAKNLRDFHAPADDVLPFNDPEGFMQYLRDMIRMNMGHN